MPRAGQFKIRGIAPPDLGDYPRGVRRQFWQWVAGLVVIQKTKEIMAGIGADGKPLRRISAKTRKYRRSAMTPTGKGDPLAPPLIPGWHKSRTISLFATSVFDDHVDCYWLYDPWTGDSWGVVLEYQRKKGRDTIGISPRGLQWIRAQAWERWRKWKAAEHIPGHTPPAPPATNPTVVRPAIPRGTAAGLQHATFGIGGSERDLLEADFFAKPRTRQEWNQYFRQSSSAAVPGRPSPRSAPHPTTGPLHNRILTHIWGVPRTPGSPAIAPAPIPVAPTRPVRRADRPMGVPVTRVLSVPPGRFASRLKTALDAAAAVHGVTGMPRVPIEVYTRPDGLYGELVCVGTPGKATPARIRIFQGGPWPEISVIHEVGHLLEGFVIPGHRKLNRDWGTDPALAGWMRAIQGSKAWKALRDARSPQIQATGRVPPDVDPQDLDLLLEWEELWARSYAQYIAIRSKHPLLLNLIDLLRGRHNPVYFHRQWDDPDFEPIAKAIDELFHKLRWRT